MLTDNFPAEVQAIFAKYPPEQQRSAVMPLLYLAQRAQGYVNKAVLEEIASLCEISTTEVASLVGFYTLFRSQDGAPYRIQVCTDLPCALRGADRFVDHVCQKLNLDPHQVRHGGQTTDDGQFTVATVPCIAGCDRAPLAQIDLGYYENLDEQKFDEIVTRLRNGPAARFRPARRQPIPWS